MSSATMVLTTSIGEPGISGNSSLRWFVTRFTACRAPSSAAAADSVVCSICGGSYSNGFATVCTAVNATSSRNVASRYCFTRWRLTSSTPSRRSCTTNTKRKSSAYFHETNISSQLYTSSRSLSMRMYWFSIGVVNSNVHKPT